MRNLNVIAKHYIPEKDFDIFLINYGFILAKKYFGKGHFLELGCATGQSTLKLLDSVDELDVVEGSALNIKKTRDKVAALLKTKKRIKKKSVVFFNSKWEDFSWPKNKYSDIIWFHGLEHIISPKIILSGMRRSLLRDGRLHIVTPNANSFHRKLGVALGMLEDVHDLNARDKKVGHVAVYDRKQVFDLLQKNGFKIKKWHGNFLKFFNNKMMLSLSKKIRGLDKALFEMGKNFSENGAELYICAVLSKFK